MAVVAVVMFVMPVLATTTANLSHADSKMVKSILPGDVPRGKAWAVSVENHTQELLAAVTIMRCTFDKQGKLVEMELYWAQWLEAGDKAKLWCVDGEYYVAMVETFFYDKETGKATDFFGTVMKEGYYDHTKKNSTKIIIKIQDPNEREA